MAKRNSNKVDPQAAIDAAIAAEIALATEMADATIASDAYKSLAGMSDGNGSTDRANGWKEWQFSASTLAYKVAVFLYAVAGPDDKDAARDAIDADDVARVDKLGASYPPSVNRGSCFQRRATTATKKAENPCGHSPYVSSIGNEHKGIAGGKVARGNVSVAMDALSMHPDLFATPLPYSGLGFLYDGRGKANGGRGTLLHPLDAPEMHVRCNRAILRTDANSPTGPATIKALEAFGTAIRANADALLLAAEQYPRTCTVNL